MTPSSSCGLSVTAALCLVVGALTVSYRLSNDRISVSHHLSIVASAAVRRDEAPLLVTLPSASPACFSTGHWKTMINVSDFRSRQRAGPVPYRTPFWQSGLCRESGRHWQPLQWVPTGTNAVAAQCAAMDNRIDRATLCRVLAGENVLFIGDSLSSHQFTSLVFLTGHGEPEWDSDWVRHCEGGNPKGGRCVLANDTSPHCNDWCNGWNPKMLFGPGLTRERASYNAFTVCNGGGKVQYVRNDKLLVGSNGSETFYGKWTDLAEDATLIVLNRGAHYEANETVFKAQSSRLMEYLAKLAKRRSAAPGGAPLRVVWRTTTAGHADCDAHVNPGAASRAAYAQAPAAAAENFGWDKFEHQTGIVRKMLMKALPRGALRFIEASQMSAERGDRHFGGGDCLHWCLPGPPDWWNKVLMLIMAEWKH